MWNVRLNTRFEYDLAGRLTKETLPDNREIAYTYDPNGNITSITPPGRPTHYFNYTPVDLTDSYVPPDIGLGIIGTTYDYNLDKELTLITRPDGQTISFGYDLAGRLNSVISTPVIPAHAGIQRSYTYFDTTGHLSSIAEANGDTLSYTYDGSLFTGAAWTGVVNGSVGFVYNNDFNISSETINGTDTINFSYDNDGLLINAGSLSISRDIQNGLITGTSLSSISTQNTYNGFGELSEERALANGVLFFTTNYTRDDLGRIVQKTETIAGVANNYAYGYDTAGRLITVSKNGSATASYTYDSNSNRISYTSGNGTVNASYDNQDRVAIYGSNSYIYTANGELENKVNTDGTTTYFYDAFGNLFSVILFDGKRIEYIVDGENRRIGKKVNGTVVQGLLYENQLRPIAELDSSGSVVSRFVYGSKGNVPDYMVRGSVTYRIISDHLGSPRFVINVGTGIVVQEISYDEFGNVIQNTNPGFQPFGFVGGLYDVDTKLTRFGVRDYDAETGRWTAKDPILFAGGDTNLYGYVQNDPVNWFDPRGLFIPPPMSPAGAAGFLTRQLLDRLLENRDKTDSPTNYRAGGAASGIPGGSCKP